MTMQMTIDVDIISCNICNRESLTKCIGVTSFSKPAAGAASSICYPAGDLQALWPYLPNVLFSDGKSAAPERTLPMLTFVAVREPQT